MPTDSAPQRLRILTANVHVFAGEPHIGDDGVSEELVVQNLQRFADLVRVQKADVVLLQEVDFSSARSAETNQGEWLSQELAMDLAQAQTLNTSGLAPEQAALLPPLLRDCRYGIAILSRLPIMRVDRVVLPNPLENPAWPRNEVRVLLQVELETGEGSSLVVATTHLDYRERATRKQQLALIAAELAGASDWVLGGDFNEPWPVIKPGDPYADYLIPHHGLNDVNGWPSAWPTLLGIPKPALKLSRPTFKTSAPMAVLDHVFAKGRAQVETLTHVDSVGISDHHFVLATVTH